MAWKIRRYIPGDEDEIYELTKVICEEDGSQHITADKDRWMRKWRWEHLQNPESNLIVVADLEGRIIGQLAQIPIPMKVGDALVKGNISADLMTHPDFRHQGVFREMQRFSRTEQVKLGFSISYAFNNEKSYAPFLRYGNVDVGRMVAMIKYFDMKNPMEHLFGNSTLATIVSPAARLAFRILHPTKPITKISNICIEGFEEFDHRFDDLWSSASRGYKIAVVKNLRYLTWRYSGNPELKFSILGAVSEGRILGFAILTHPIVRHNRRIGYITDIFADLSHAEMLPLLVSEAVKKLREEKASEAVCWILEDDPCFTVLKDQGFVRVKKGLPLTSASLQPAINQTLISNGRNWHLTLGDMDGMFPIFA